MCTMPARTVPAMRPHITESLPDYMQWETVSSLVGSRRTESLVAYPTSETACRETIAFCRRNGLSICARGGGYSYGDMILNDQNVLLNTTKMDRILDFDEDGGLITVEPGVKMLDIYERAHHLRFALAASPSESTITVAGAIAANVNGKDAWRLGNFGDQVVNLKLLTASGESISVDRVENEKLFLAVVGGMGLLGIIVQATIRLERIPSPFLEISRIPVDNVGELLDRLDVVEATSDFAVVWLDTCAKGAKLGRAVIHAAKWVEREASPRELRAEIAVSLARLNARRRQARKLYGVTEFLLAAMLQFQRITVPLFNEFYFLYSRLRRRQQAMDNIESFLQYNFDASFIIPSPAIVCGPRGYTIQLLVSRSNAREAITEMIELCQSSPCVSVKTIMRLHRRDDHLISFSEDGYSLNFEFHPKKRHEERMRRFVNDLIECVIRYRGKVHLAKEMILTQDQFQRLFPMYDAFLEVKRKLDPYEIFQSDMYRRLMHEDARDVPTLKRDS